MTAPATNGRVRTLIVDDEALGRDLLCRLALRDPDIEVIGQAVNGREALAMAGTLDPQLVLLDIQMPRPNGLEVASRLAGLGAAVPWIIFVTAFDTHAVEAFELNALDYLVKPVGKSRFDQAIARAKQAIRHCEMAALAQRLMALATSAAVLHQSPGPELLTIRAGDRLIPLPVDAIEWVEADNQYVRVHTADRTHVLPCSLGQFERRVPPTSLVRVHRSALVNPERIAYLRRRANGLHEIELVNGTRIMVARSRRSIVPQLARRMRRSSP